MWEEGLVITREQLRLVAFDLQGVCHVSSSWLPSRETVFTACVEGPLQVRKGRLLLGCGIPGGFLRGHRQCITRHQSSGKGNFNIGQLWTSLHRRSIHLGNHPKRANLDLEQFGHHYITGASIIDDHSTFRTLLYGHRKRDRQRWVDTLFDSLSPLVIFCNNIPIVTIAWLHLRVFSQSAALYKPPVPTPGPNSFQNIICQHFTTLG